MFILLYPPVVTGRLNPVDNVNDLDDDIKYHRWKWPHLRARKSPVPTKEIGGNSLFGSGRMATLSGLIEVVPRACRTRLWGRGVNGSTSAFGKPSRPMVTASDVWERSGSNPAGSTV